MDVLRGKLNHVPRSRSVFGVGEGTRSKASEKCVETHQAVVYNLPGAQSLKSARLIKDSAETPG